MCEFYTGDMVRYINGNQFGDGGYSHEKYDVVTVKEIEIPSPHTKPSDYRIWFEETNTWAYAHKLVKVATPQPLVPPLPVFVVPPTEQAFKADAGKPMWHLLTKGCARALDGVVKVLSFAVAPKEQGGKGYVPHSWKSVPNAIERYESALHRHLNAINRGELVDSESGLSHWDHVATNALFLSELTKSAEVPNVTSNSI